MHWRNPDHERIASGLGSGDASRRLPVIPAVEGARNGAAARSEAGTKQFPPPTPRQLARWQAIQQAQLQGLSLRAPSELLGIARGTVSSCVRANGVPGRRNGPAASSNGRGGTDRVADRRQSQQSGWSRRNASRWRTRGPRRLKGFCRGSPPANHAPLRSGEPPRQPVLGVVHVLVSSTSMWADGCDDLVEQQVGRGASEQHLHGGQDADTIQWKSLSRLVRMPRSRTKRIAGYSI